MCAWRATSTLFQLGEIGRVHVYRLRRFGEDRAVFLGFGGDLLPFRIRPELRPVLLGRFQAGMHHDVDQRGFRFLRIPWDPVAYALNSVALEDFDGVVAEARLQGLQLAFITGVGAQFVDTV